MPPADVDWVLQVVTKRYERYVVAKLFATTPDIKRLLWSGVFPASASSAYIKLLGSAAGKKTRDQLAGPNTLPPAPTDDALVAYVQGLIFLDGARTELMVRRAESTFLRAQRLAPQWADASAMLCNAYIQEHFFSRVSESLDAAKAQCRKAADTATQ